MTSIDPHTNWQHYTGQKHIVIHRCVILPDIPGVCTTFAKDLSSIHWIFTEEVFLNEFMPYNAYSSNNTAATTHVLKLLAKDSQDPIRLAQIALLFPTIPDAGT